MATFDIIMPKMGESIQEATITNWFVKVGDTIEEDDVLLEIATDKVDSEIPSPVEGVVKEIRFGVDEVVPVGEVVAVIALAGEEEELKETKVAEPILETGPETEVPLQQEYKDTSRFYSPLVRSIARSEGLSLEILESISGTGLNGRVTKTDILSFLETRGAKPTEASAPVEEKREAPVSKQVSQVAMPSKERPKVSVSVNAGDEIIEMDRMRKIIAEHMVTSKQISPHVTGVVEADVTNLVLWRNRVKEAFGEKYKEKLTFMPVFTEAVARALRDFPMVNSSVDGDKIIIRKEVNIGIAVSLPSGNLIVPVIKQADQKNLVGLAASINGLANQARTNKLSPDDIQGGTFTITNFGSFRNTIGTPIINQPQVAILATGTIEKKPAVVETPTGDVIAIRHKMFLSLSYDHRIVDGALGGQFLRRIADYLEEFDMDRGI